MTEQSISRALVRTAEAMGDRVGITFISLDGKEENYLSYETLAGRSAQVAHALIHDGCRKGERIGLIIPENEKFVTSFFGVLHAGLVPVPLAPPMNVGRLNLFLSQLQHIAVQSELSLIITSEKIKSLLGTLVRPPLRRILTFDELELNGVEAPLASVGESDLAFLQFTSGSTAKPKGVAISQRNLFENISSINNHGICITQSDVACSWLPLFHDMGLIGFLMCPMVSGIPLYLTSPLSFIRRPVLWLEMISKFRGTLSFGPNFAYGLCVKRIKDEELTGVDLSSWTVAGCGAEPIQEETLVSFAMRFAHLGFQSTSLFPTYGMAESTLAVSFPPRGRELSVDEVDTHEMARTKHAVPAQENSENSVRIVSCGSPFPAHDIAIFTCGEIHKREREIGEILICGPSVTQGYFNNPEANEFLFVQGWLRTGDLGYLVNGEIFICGREKEVIIIGGRNYYPTDIESLLGDIEGVRKGNVVAFGLSDVMRGEETFVVCAETRAPASELEDLERRIRGRILEALGIHAGEVMLLAPDSLPKTSSGKLQRTKTKELYLSADLGKKSLTKEKIEFIKHWARSQWSYLKNP